MVYSHQLENNWLMMLAIFLAWIPSLATVLFGGMLITLMAVQIISKGS